MPTCRWPATGSNSQITLTDELRYDNPTVNGSVRRWSTSVLFAGNVGTSNNAGNAFLGQGRAAWTYVVTGVISGVSMEGLNVSLDETAFNSTTTLLQTSVNGVPDASPFGFHSVETP